MFVLYFTCTINAVPSCVPHSIQYFPESRLRSSDSGHWNEEEEKEESTVIRIFAAHHHRDHPPTQLGIVIPLP